MGLQESLASSAIKCSSLVTKFADEKAKLAGQRDEYHTQAVRLGQRDAQYSAGMKRKEAEYDKLRTAMEVMRGSKPSKGGERNRAGKGKQHKEHSTFPQPFSTSKSEEQYSNLVLALEFRQGSLLLENNSLRVSLGEACGRLDEVAAKQAVVCEYIATSRERARARGLAKEVPRMDVPVERFLLPMEYVARVQGEMRRKLEALKSQISAAAEDGKADEAGAAGEDAERTAAEEEGARLRVENGKLRSRVDKLRAIVGQQDDLIQAAIFDDGAEGGGGGDD